VRCKAGLAEVSRAAIPIYDALNDLFDEPQLAALLSRDPCEVCGAAHGEDKGTQRPEALVQGAVEIASLDAPAIERASALMAKYEDLPMDFADATLVVLAESLGTTTVFTLDRRDFGIYQLGRRKLTLLPRVRYLPSGIRGAPKTTPVSVTRSRRLRDAGCSTAVCCVPQRDFIRY